MPCTGCLGGLLQVVLAATACAEVERHTADRPASDDASAGGSAGTLEPIDCRIDVAGELSDAIPTVGIVTFETNLVDVDQATIEYGPDATSEPLRAPVELTAPGHRTLVLGMKPERDYTLRIRLTSEDSRCVSDEFTLSTGALPESVPVIEQQVFQPEQVSPGFIVTSAGLGGLAPDGGDGPPVFVVDRDGVVVWWADAPVDTSRARMSFDGTSMWMLGVNVDAEGGRLRRVSMDGLNVEDIPDLENAHHDFTVLPGGGVAAIAWTASCNGVVERSADGAMIELVPDIASLYVPAEDDCHTNAIQYQPWSDTFTVADRSVNLVTKFTRDGELVWQLGGENPLGVHLPVVLEANHGHHLLQNGNLILFNNGPVLDPATVYEVAIDEALGTATIVWEYTSELGTFSLGDAQRLRNGNTLVTYSNPGVIHEVDAEGELVRTLTSEGFGYANHRESLYGAPDR